MEKITTLSIETSCDETAISILQFDTSTKKFKIYSHKLISQIDIHQQYGGVFPSLAKREHSKNLLPILESILSESIKNGLEVLDNSQQKNTHNNPLIVQKTFADLFVHEEFLANNFYEKVSTLPIPKIDFISVTDGPGLEPALWVGINFAKALSLMWNLPIVPINHMEGHIASVFLNESALLNNFSIDNLSNIFPAISLLASGGHTEIVYIEDIGKYKVVGKTKDDASGEAFDKVARLLDLKYPGGPEISKHAKNYRDKMIGNKPNDIFGNKIGAKIDTKIATKNQIEKHEKQKEQIRLPRPMLNSNDLDFSFSGLKTAVLYKIKDLQKNPENNPLSLELKEKIAKEFEDAVIEVLVSKTISATEKFNAKSIILGGGVVANEYLKKQMQNATEKTEVKLLCSSKELSTDNALMIATAGLLNVQKFGLEKITRKHDEIIADGNKSL